MIIIAGWLRVDPADRERYLEAVADVAGSARKADGCLDFVQAADVLDPGRINVYERWESDEHLHRFRESGGDDGPQPPPIVGADVRKYRISGVEEP
ncbi:antibiotic biosynthesis monooxygenase family protein [Actinoplanes sp. NPDC049802]|uniref:putative quinol monooxygenase n=1 Tax=Actinoplanes sp. NPDC049802 TaxID=3154742 RepID=UPI0033E1148C